MADNPRPMSKEDVESFHRDGYLLLKGFFDAEEDILPVQQGVYDVIGLVIKRHGLDIEREPFSPETFDSGFMELCAINRAWGGEVYDAIKLLPDLVRLVASRRLESMFAQLRETARVGLVSGYGIRIDMPGEERFTSPWHQEYLSHFRSIDGIVFWTPLLPVSHELGPVRLSVGSHKEGIQRVYPIDDTDQTGLYALRIEHEKAIREKCPEIAPTSEPGDLFLIDFLTLHASGQNISDRARWSIQARSFNFNDPVGTEIGWRGSMQAGFNISDVHPELLMDKPPAETES